MDPGPVMDLEIWIQAKTELFKTKFSQIKNKIKIKSKQKFLSS
jgi:hypothetical protein